MEKRSKKKKGHDNSPSKLNIVVEAAIGKRFLECIGKLGENNSEVLSFLLGYQERADQVSLKRFETGEENLKKNLLVIMAILRNIEKTQTKPMLAMLQLLFRETPQKQSEILLEKKQGKEVRFQQEEQLPAAKPKMDYLEQLLEKITPGRSGFGRKRLQLEMSLEEFYSLKEKIRKELCS